MKHKKEGTFMKEIKLHTKLTKKITVEESMLASHVGSGIVDVYATPMMIALQPV